MKQFELNGKIITFVEVDSDACNFCISVPHFENPLTYKENVFSLQYEKVTIVNKIFLETLPDGKYRFLCLSKNMTEEIAKSLVNFFQITRVMIGGYKDYVNSNNETEHFTLNTALESFRSFENFIKIIDSKNYAILIKEQ